MGILERKTKMTTQTLLGIELLDWDGWDDCIDDKIFLYNPQWKFPSMQKYNGMVMEIDRSGNFNICDNDNGCNVFQEDQSFLSIPEFRQSLLEKVGTK